MLYMGDTHDEEDVLMIFDECKTHYCKFRSREDDFSSKVCCRWLVDNELPASLRFMSRTTTHADYDLVVVLFSFSDPELCTYWWCGWWPIWSKGKSLPLECKSTFSKRTNDLKKGQFLTIRHVGSIPHSTLLFLVCWFSALIHNDSDWFQTKQAQRGIAIIFIYNDQQPF